MGKLSDIRDKMFGRKRPPLVSERIPSAAYEDLPPAIAAKLKASARRVRRIVALRGIFATVAVFVVALLLAMAIDAMVVIFSPYVRWGIWAAVVGATLYTANRTIRRPLSRPFTPARIAALIEQNHPELEERLSTVVELIGMGEGTAASKRLMEVLTEDAVIDAGKVSPSREFSARTVKPRFFAAVAALAVVAALVAAFPRAMGRLITRAVVPSAEVDNIYASSLSVTPGDAVILEGTPFTVQLAVKAGFPSKAYVRTRREGEGESVERMAQTSADSTRGGSTFYTFNYPQVTKSFAYRINCGSALTRGFTVNAVPVPSFTNLSVKLSHPAYTRREPDVMTNAAPSPISTLAGTDVEISAKPARHDMKATLLLPQGKTLDAEMEPDGRFKFAFSLTDKMQGQWGVLLVDQYGFSNHVEYAGLSVAKDAAPTVRIVSPEQLDFELPSFGQLPFEYTATDDFGFDYVRVEMTDESGNFVKAFDLSPEETSKGSWTGADSIEIAKYDFGQRPFARFRLAVSDTLPAELGGPQVAYSQEMTVRFVKNALSLEGKQLAEQIKGARKTIDEVIKRLEQAKRMSGEASRCFGKPPNNWEYSQRWNKLDGAKKGLLESEKLMAELCSNMDDTLLAKPGEPVKQVLDEHVVPARRYCEDIYMVETDPEKSERSNALTGKIADAIAALKQARADFDKAAKDALDLQKLADFAEREKELAEMAKEGEIDPELWAKRQEELMNEFEKTFAEKLNDPLAKQEEKVDALRERGEDLKKRQEELAKDSAALKGDDAAAREQAEKDIREKGKDLQMPADSKAEDIASALESELAKDIADFAEKADQVADQLKRQEEGQKNQQGQDGQKNPEQQQDQSGETASQQVDNASETAQDAAKIAQDAAEAMKKGDDAQAGQDMKNVQDKLDKAGKRLDQAMDSLEKRSDEMRGGNTEQFEEARDQMQEATKDAREAADNFAKAQEAAEAARQQQGDQQQGDQQQGEQQQGDQQQGQQQQGEQQQGDQQQGQQQQGEQQQGDQQQGQQQQGEQQQGDQQQGQQQQGDQQQGDQQQGQQQQGQQQQGQQQQGQQQKSEAQKNAEQAAQDAMQQAAQAAQQAAQQMQQAAQQKAEQMGMTPEQMQQLQDQMQQEGRSGQNTPGGKVNDKNQNKNPGKEDKKGKKNTLKKGVDGLLDGDDADWFKNLSKLQPGEIEDALQNVPAEYRGLVREYFSELSKEAKK